MLFFCWIKLYSWKTSSNLFAQVIGEEAGSFSVLSHVPLCLLPKPSVQLSFFYIWWPLAVTSPDWIRPWLLSAVSCFFCLGYRAWPSRSRTPEEGICHWLLPLHPSSAWIWASENAFPVDFHLAILSSWGKWEIPDLRSLLFASQKTEQLSPACLLSLVML